MICRNACARSLYARSLPAIVVLAMAVAAAQAQSNQTSTQSAPNKAKPGQTASGSSSGDTSVQAATNSSSSPSAATAPADQNQPAAQPTPIEFESKGIAYEALTKEGITVMFAALPPHIKEFNIVQVTVTNGSLVAWTVRPSDFTFVRQDGTQLQPVSADEVVESLLEKASRNDVIKLQLLYEDTIYALSNFRSTNGYEQRREAAMAQMVNRGFKAAAAASALTLVPTKLKPGDSTDGAVFFENKTKEKTLGAGRLLVHTCGQSFIFENYPELKSR
jgi:hypothetical protein